MSKNPLKTGVLCLTVNVHGTSVERRAIGSGSLLGRFSYGRYGANVGNGRLLEMFRQLDLKATFFVPAYEAESDPALIDVLMADGHEVAAHGFAMEDYSRLGDEEFDLLARAHEVLTRMTGTAPIGWRAPEGRMSTATLSYLSRLGYRYDSSFQDDDFPYSLSPDGGGSMVELPQNPMMIDATIYRAWQTHDRLAKHWTEEFDAAADEDCFMCLTLHGRSDYGSGRASRVAVVKSFLAAVLDRGIPIKRCADMI